MHIWRRNWGILIPSNPHKQKSPAYTCSWKPEDLPFFMAEVSIDSMGWVCQNHCAIWWQMLLAGAMTWTARLKEAMQQHCCGQSLQRWILRDTLSGCQGVHGGVATPCPAQPCAHCCSVFAACGKGCLQSDRPWAEFVLPSSSGVWVQNLRAHFHEWEKRGLLVPDSMGFKKRVSITTCFHHCLVQLNEGKEGGV